LTGRGTFWAGPLASAGLYWAVGVGVSVELPPVLLGEAEDPLVGAGWALAPPVQPVRARRPAIAAVVSFAVSPAARHSTGPSAPLCGGALSGNCAGSPSGVLARVPAGAPGMAVKRPRRWEGRVEGKRIESPNGLARCSGWVNRSPDHKTVQGFPQRPSS
jgi:hypothetical protein